MFSLLHDGLDQVAGVGPVFPCPLYNPGGSPLEVFLVGFGHVFRKGCVGAPYVASRMAGNPAVLEEGLDDPRRHPQLHLLFHKLIGNTVVVAVELDVIIDIHSRLFPLGVFKAQAGSGFKAGRSIVS